MSTSIELIKHLHWRCGMGLTPDEIRQREGMGYDELVSELFANSGDYQPLRVQHETITLEAYRALTPREQFAFRRRNREITAELNLLWMQQLRRTEGSLREKMAFFWHGHFACWSHWSNTTEQYLNTLREHALGKFPDLLKAVSRAPAMLEFLNAQQNRKNAPNENFAREVMELFTLGRGNYTEQDIQEAARAFTGWSAELRTATFVFREQWHDEGSKTFRGRTGNFDGDDILDLIVEDPQCARFICDRLYRWLVKPDPDDAFIGEMAARFQASGMDIGDLVRFVVSHPHFQQPACIGARVKSPVELLSGMDKLFNIRFEQEQQMLFLQRAMGQVLLHPPSVAGWAGHTAWIDSNAMMMRLQLPAALLNQGALDWSDPEEAPEDQSMMMDEAASMPMRDTRGRRLRALPDRDGLLAQFPTDADTDTLCQFLLDVPPSDALRRSISGAALWERVLEILSSPEYQLC